MSITTIGRVVQLPDLASGQSHVRADQPLTAGTAMILASNGTHLARENSLRAVYNHDGSLAVYRALYDPLRYETFAWNGYIATGTLALFCGLHRLRPYGEQSFTLPRVAVRWRWEVTIDGGANAAFALCVVTPGFEWPSISVYPYATTTVTEVVAPIGAPVDGALDVTVPIAVPSRVPCTPRPSNGTALPSESGFTDTVGIWLGFGTVSGKGANPAHIHGLTVFLEEP